MGLHRGSGGFGIPRMQGLENRVVVVDGSLDPPADGLVVPRRRVLDRLPEEPGQLRRPARHRQQVVEPVVQVLDLLQPPFGQRRSEAALQFVELGQVVVGQAGHRAGDEFALELGLHPEQVADVVAGQWGDHEPAAWFELQQALGPQGEQAFAHGRHADPEFARALFQPDELGEAQMPGHSQYAHVGRDLVGQGPLLAAAAPGAHRLRRRIRHGLDLTCSPGIALLRRPHWDGSPRRPFPGSYIWAIKNGNTAPAESEVASMPGTSGPGERPLEGLHVVECASFVAGPSGGMALARLGADVLRVDPPGGGGDFHRWPVDDQGTSLYWAGLNKGKRSLALNFRTPEGRELLLALATEPGADSGVYLDNVAGRTRLTHEELTARRPDVIHAHRSEERRCRET